jgi:hypothetical protein
MRIVPRSQHKWSEQMMKDTSSLIILGLESLLRYSTRLGLELPCSNGWASQLRRLRLVWNNNREGILYQWSQEVAIKRAPRPNWTITGCSNLMTDGPSVEPSWGLAIPHHKPVQARNCAATSKTVVALRAIAFHLHSFEMRLFSPLYSALWWHQRVRERVQIALIIVHINCSGVKAVPGCHSW